MANTDANYSEMVNKIVETTKKFEGSPLPASTVAALDFGITAVIVLIDIASSFNRIAKAMEHDKESRIPVTNPDAVRKPFPTV